MSDPTLFARDYNIRPRTWDLQFQTPRFSWEITISVPDNVRPHAFRARLQYQAPTMSDPTLSRNHNIKPRQCQTPRFSLACVAGGIRERARERRSRYIPSRSPRGNPRSARGKWIQLDSSPILSRLRHSCSQLLYQNKSTRAPATQAIFSRETTIYQAPNMS